MPPLLESSLDGELSALAAFFLEPLGTLGFSSSALDAFALLLALALALACDLALALALAFALDLGLAFALGFRPLDVPFSFSSSSSSSSWASALKSAFSWSRRTTRGGSMFRSAPTEAPSLLPREPDGGNGSEVAGSGPEVAEGEAPKEAAGCEASKAAGCEASEVAAGMGSSKVDPGAGSEVSKVDGGKGSEVAGVATAPTELGPTPPDAPAATPKDTPLEDGRAMLSCQETVGPGKQ